MDRQSVHRAAFIDRVTAYTQAELDARADAEVRADD
jgi:hypothetical protein